MDKYFCVSRPPDSVAQRTKTDENTSCTRTRISLDHICNIFPFLALCFQHGVSIRGQESLVNTNEHTSKTLLMIFFNRKQRRYRCKTGE